MPTIQEVLRENSVLERQMKNQASMIRAMRRALVRLRTENQKQAEMIEFYRSMLLSSAPVSEADMKKRIAEMYDVHCG